MIGRNGRREVEDTQSQPFRIGGQVPKRQEVGASSESGGAGGNTGGWRTGESLIGSLWRRGGCLLARTQAPAEVGDHL